MFQCSLSRRKDASSGEAGFRLRVRLSKTSEFEEWKALIENLRNHKAGCFNALSRRKEASFGKAGFRLQREVI